MKKSLFSLLCLSVLFCFSCKNEDDSDMKKNFHDLKKIDSYLYEVTFDDFSEENLDKAFLDSFSCSSVKNGNFYGRNFDYYFNDCPDFIVHVKAKKNKHGFVGMSVNQKIHDADVFEQKTVKSLNVMATAVLDGINDCGVISSCNVVDKNDVAPLIGTNPGAKDLNVLHIVSYILRNANSADNAIELLKERNIIGCVSDEYNLHYMIADKDKTYIVEFIDGKLNVQEKTGNEQIMTNFYNNLPEYTENASGVERYKLLQENYDIATSANKMHHLMSLVRFSNTYRDGNNHYSDAIEKTIWENQESEEFKEFLKEWNTARAPLLKIIEDDIRDGKNSKVWWTVHSSVYDIEKRELSVAVQEQFEKIYHANINGD